MGRVRQAASKFLDASASVVAEWCAYAHSTRDAIELTEGVDYAANSLLILARYAMRRAPC